MNIRSVSARTVSLSEACMSRLQDLGEETLADILIQSKHPKLMCICKAFGAILRADKRNCQEFCARRNCSFEEIYDNIKNMRPVKNAVFLNLENVLPIKSSLTTEAIYLGGLLSKFKHVREISFRNCSLGFAGLAVLTICRNLEKLWLKRCDIKQSQKCVLALLLHFNAKTLKEIDFSGNPNLTIYADEAMGLSLQKCTNLQSLNFGQEISSKNVFKALALTFENALPQMTSLTKLSLISPHYYRDMKVLFENLNKLTKLKTLKCVGNGMMHEENVGFLDFTLLPCSLESLHLQTNFCRSFDAGFLTAQAETFRKLTCLKTLNLHNNQFDPAMLQQFMADDSIFKGLTSLNLSRNCLTNEAVFFLANTFSQLTSLHDLDLSANDVRGLGGLALVNNMHKCPSFRTLNLNRNCLVSKSVERMLEQSLSCTSLVSLSVVGNPLGKTAENDLKTTIVKLFRQGLRKDFELLF